MSPKRGNASEEPAVQQECHHYWIIEMATGPRSKGTCTFCGAQKEFKNYPSDHLEPDEEFRLWIRRPPDDKKERKSEEDVLSLLGRG